MTSDSTDCVHCHDRIHAKVHTITCYQCGTRRSREALPRDCHPIINAINAASPA